MKKIVAHIQRTVTMTTINTALDVWVSDDDLTAPAIPPREPSVDLAIPEEEQNEETEADSITLNANPAMPTISAPQSASIVATANPDQSQELLREHG